MNSVREPRFAGVGLTSCYSFSGECWHAYYWIDFGFFGEFRRLGPAFETKAEVDGFLAIARRGELDLFATANTSKGSTK